MIRIVIVNSEGKFVTPEELASAAELQQAVHQARNLIRDCERLAQSKSPANAAKSVAKAPYS